MEIQKQQPRIEDEFVYLANGTKLHLPTLELLTERNFQFLKIEGYNNVVNMAGNDIYLKNE